VFLGTSVIAWIDLRELVESGSQRNALRIDFVSMGFRVNIIVLGCYWNLQSCCQDGLGSLRLTFKETEPERAYAKPM